MEKVRDGYKMTELGEIPTEWSIKKLKDVIKEFIVPMRDKPKNFDGSIPWCRIEDIEGKYINDSKSGQYVTEKTIEEMNLKIHPTGTVICSCSASLGIYAIVTSPLTTNQTFIGLFPTELVCSDYLYYAMNDSTDRLRSIASGTTILYISREKFEKFKIFVPSINEQQKIALILSSVDEKIEITDNLIEKTKELKKGLMQRLLTKGIGHDRFKDTEIGRIPEEWQVRKLGEISILITKGTTPSTYGYEFVNEGVNFIKIENISDTGKIKINSLFKISEECNEKLSRSKIEENDILVSIAGSLGKSIIISSDIAPANTNQALAIVRLDINKYSNQYINFIFSSILLKKYVEKVSTVGAQPNLSLQQIGDFKIPIPTINEQKKIASILSSVDEKIEQYEVEKEKLKEIKKGLMQKLLTGKIRVK